MSTALSPFASTSHQQAGWCGTRCTATTVTTAK